MGINTKYNPQDYMGYHWKNRGPTRIVRVFYTDMKDFSHLASDMTLAIKNGWVEVDAIEKSVIQLWGVKWVIENLYDHDRLHKY
jgi:hypothetical protein